MPNINDGRDAWRREHPTTPTTAQPDADVYTFEALAGSAQLRGRARYAAKTNATVRKTLADVEQAYGALGHHTGGDAA